MTRTKLLLYGVLVLALGVAAPCRADLFAALSAGTEILRIDSTTGDVTRTYPIPPFFPVTGSPTMGLAFDGRILYLNRNAGTFNLLFQLDVVDEIWFPPVVMDTFFNPSGLPQPVSGLGFVPGDFGIGSLIAVSRNPTDAPPSYIFKYDIFFPGFPDPIINVNIPVGNCHPTWMRKGQTSIRPRAICGSRPTSSGGLRAYRDSCVPISPAPCCKRSRLWWTRRQWFVALALMAARCSSPGGTCLRKRITSMRSIARLVRFFDRLPCQVRDCRALTGGNVIPEPGVQCSRHWQWWAWSRDGVLAAGDSTRRPAAAPRRMQLPRATACLAVRSRNPARRRRTAESRRRSPVV